MIEQIIFENKNQINILTPNDEIMSYRKKIIMKKSPIMNKTIGIYTNNRDCAKQIIRQLCDDVFKVRQIFESRSDLEIVMKDGTRIRWIRPIETNRGFRLYKAYVESSLIGTDIYDTVIIPSCVGCKEEDIIII